MSKPDVSVIIPSYNSGRQLIPCLRSVLSQDYGGEVEVVVVDDGSTDGSIEAARDQFPSIVLVRTERSGWDASRQAGLDAARGVILSNTDADCVVASTWISAIVKELENGAVAATGPVIHPDDLLSTVVAAADFPDFQSRRPSSVRNFAGCNFGIGRDALNHYGYRVHKDIICGADRLLSWRLTRNGQRIAYSPEAHVHHYPDVHPWGLLRRRRRYAITAALMRKIDPSLPGGRFSRLGRLAAPVYCGARMARDLTLIAQLVVQRRIAPWQMATGLFWSPLLRGLDMVYMLRGSFEEVTALPQTTDSVSELVTSE